MILLAGSFWMASSLQPLYRSPRSIRRAGRYFVCLQEGASEEELLQQLREGNDDRGRPEFKAHMLCILKSTVNGFVGQLSPRALDMVSLVVVFASLLRRTDDSCKKCRLGTQTTCYLVCAISLTS